MVTSWGMSRVLRERMPGRAVDAPHEWGGHFA
jgi:hypothetical protein